MTIAMTQMHTERANWRPGVCFGPQSTYTHTKGTSCVCVLAKLIRLCPLDETGPSSLVEMFLRFLAASFSAFASDTRESSKELYLIN